MFPKKSLPFFKLLEIVISLIIITSDLESKTIDDNFHITRYAKLTKYLIGFQTMNDDIQISLQQPFSQPTPLFWT